MPLPFYHISLAGALAEKYPAVRESGDFFLGNIAPDAVLSRSDCTLAAKFETHLRRDRLSWRDDVLKSFERSDKSDRFALGYHMHLVTDIFFRDRWEADFRRAGIPETEWDGIAYRLASLGIIRLLHEGAVRPENYERWISQARRFRTEEFPFGMTRADMTAEIDFVAKLSSHAGIEIEEKQEDPADFADIYRSAIPYLNGMFGAYLKDDG